MENLSTSDILKRGFFLKCPKCGTGKLFHGYLTPRAECGHCHQDFARLRADDGPAWATILITGHLAMPFAFWILESDIQSLWAQISILIGLVLLMSGLILPRAKGMFMAMIWKTQLKKTES